VAGSVPLARHHPGSPPYPCSPCCPNRFLDYHRLLHLRRKSPYPSSRHRTMTSLNQ
jgi:hypothetical protein